MCWRSKEKGSRSQWWRNARIWWMKMQVKGQSVAFRLASRVGPGGKKESDRAECEFKKKKMENRIEKRQRKRRRRKIKLKETNQQTNKQTIATQEIVLTRMFFTSTARTTKLYDGRLAEWNAISTNTRISLEMEQTQKRKKDNKKTIRILLTEMENPRHFERDRIFFYRFLSPIFPFLFTFFRSTPLKKLVLITTSMHVHNLFIPDLFCCRFDD